MAKYAQKTTVDVGRSLQEIQDLLRRYGATQFLIDYEQNRIGFSLLSRKVIFTMPAVNIDHTIQKTPTGKNRNADAQQTALAQKERQQWRALLLIIKAKLEAIDSGITTLDQEFMAFYLLKNGQTLAQTILPQLQQPDIIPKLNNGVN